MGTPQAREWVMGSRMLRAVVLLMASISSSACTPEPVSIVVDPSVPHQVIQGWEVTARLWEFDKANDRYDGSWVARREAIAERLVDDVGIDRLRLGLRSGTENPVDYWSAFAAGRIGYREFKRHFYEKINDNADPLVSDPARFQFSELDWRVENIVLPVKRRVEARGRVFRLNLNYADFKWTELKGPLSHAANPQEYAELIVATFDHLKSKYGLVPDMLELVLEPDNSDDWRGREIGRAAVAVAARLHAAGYRDVALIAPSTAKASRALPYFKDMAAVPGAVAQLSTLAYHRYDGVPDAAALHGIRDAAHAAGLTTAMLEYVDGDIDDLLADVVDADAAAWQQYGIGTRAGGEAKPGWLIIADAARTGPGLELSAAARRLALVFDAVDAGSRRIDARSSGSGVRAAGFLTPAGGLVLVARAQAAAPVSISGLPPGRYRLSRVDADGSPAQPETITASKIVALSMRPGETLALVSM